MPDCPCPLPQCLWSRSCCRMARRTQLPRDKKRDACAATTAAAAAAAAAAPAHAPLPLLQLLPCAQSRSDSPQPETLHTPARHNPATPFLTELICQFSPQPTGQSHPTWHSMPSRGTPPALSPSLYCSVAHNHASRAPQPCPTHPLPLCGTRGPLPYRAIGVASSDGGAHGRTAQHRHLRHRAAGGAGTAAGHHGAQLPHLGSGRWSNTRSTARARCGKHVPVRASCCAGTRESHDCLRSPLTPQGSSP